MYVHIFVTCLTYIVDSFDSTKPYMTCGTMIFLSTNISSPRNTYRLVPYSQCKFSNPKNSVFGTTPCHELLNHCTFKISNSDWIFFRVSYLLVLVKHVKKSRHFNFYLNVNSLSTAS